jgi:hypothetical protein
MKDSDDKKELVWMGEKKEKSPSHKFFFVTKILQRLHFFL